MKVQILKKSEVLNLLPTMNREVNGAHVTKLVESIRLMGCIRPVIVVECSFIDGVMRKYLLEGQHLYNALLRLNMDIPYVVVKVANVEDLIEKMALLNASSKPWCMVNYIHAWSSIKPVFSKLKKYYNRYDMELSILVSILMDLDIPTSTGGSKCLDHIKKGSFRIINEKTAVIILNAIDDVFTVIKRLGRQENKYVCSEFVRMYRLNEGSYNHKRFIKNLQKNKEKFIMATHEVDTLSKMFKNLI